EPRSKPVQSPRSKVQGQETSDAASTLDFGLGTLDSSPPTSQCGGEPKKTVLTARPHVANVQLLKVAQRATTDLGRLAELEPLPSAAEQTQGDKRALAEKLVTELIEQA